MLGRCRGRDVDAVSCAFPPTDPGNGLIEAERALFAALARRDRARLEQLIAPDVVLRIPGQPDASRATLLDGLASTPGEILDVTGDPLRAHLAGDTGIVEGIQLARVRLDGKVVEDRGAFVDVFARHDGAWRLIFALDVSLPEPAARWLRLEQRVRATARSGCCIRPSIIEHGCERIHARAVGPLHAIVAHSFGAAAALMAHGRGDVDARRNVMIAPSALIDDAVARFARRVALDDRDVHQLKSVYPAGKG